MKNKARNGQLQQRVVAEAARLMVEQGLDNPHQACRKAAARLGVRDPRQLPKPDQVDRAVQEYLRLFRGAEHPRELGQLRETALQAMQALEPFQPRLVGPVLQGSADRGSRVQLHLFADTPEEVIFRLLELGIPWREGERTHQYPDGRRRRHPSFRFRAGGSEVELVVFPVAGLRQPPLEPGQQRPLERASRGQLERLLAQRPDQRSLSGT